MPKSNQWPFCELLIESRVLFLAVYDGSNNLKIRFEGPKMVKDGTTYYLVTDQVGSIRAVVDTLGMTVKEITYDSFGNIIADTNPTFTIPLGFAGGLHDRDTNLVLFGYRNYDPETGRWTAKDPIGFDGGDADLYAYCTGDPINLIDYDGLETILTSWIPDKWLGNLSDFFAGMGDTISFGATRWYRQKHGFDCVNTDSGWYTGGEVAGFIHGLASGGAVGRAAMNGVVKGGLRVSQLGRLSARVGLFHSAHHPFKYLGGIKYRHSQITFYIKGIKKSGKTFHFPWALPPKEYAPIGLTLPFIGQGGSSPEKIK